MAVRSKRREKIKYNHLFYEILIVLQMSALMYYCALAALWCSLGFAWTIIRIIKSTSLDESGQRRREGERLSVCVLIFCDSVCVRRGYLSIYLAEYTGTEMDTVTLGVCVYKVCVYVWLCALLNRPSTEAVVFLLTRKTKASATVLHRSGRRCHWWIWPRWGHSAAFSQTQI